jgi:phosphopantothenoylcysteine synthetase/decarboxylase
LSDQAARRVLYVITCATPAARDVGKLVALAQEREWTVCVIATPSALQFIDQMTLEKQTGFPVRSDYKAPDAPDVLPPADAMIVGGASFNTINKWALGISDTLALGLLTEAIGMRLPLVVLPFLNAAQATHPAFGRSVTELRQAGVTVLLGPDGYEPHQPKQGSMRLADYPWQAAVDEIERRVMEWRKSPR